MKKIIENKWKIFIIFLIVLSIFRIYLQYNIPLYYVGSSEHDDDLLISYADNIMTGNWLGEYNYLTLVKGITFSIFLVLGYISRIPYSIILTLINIIASILFVRSIKPLVKNKYFLGILYIFLIFSPVTMEYKVVQRIYRNSLTFSMVLFVLAGFIGTYLNLSEKKKSIKWAVLAGISLFLFWNLREDTIWIVPFCVVSSIISCIAIILKFLKEKNKKIFIKLIVIMLPYIILFIGNGIICGLNYHYYGIYELNDRTGSKFAELISLMIKIDYEEEAEDVIISKDKMEYIVDSSESLSSIKEKIMDCYEAWTFGGEEVKGDLFVWSFRTALEETGYYENATKANNFCRQVKEELEEKIENRDMSISDGIFVSSSTKMVKIEDIPSLLQKSVESLDYLMSYRTIETKYISSNGTEERIRQIERLINSLLIHSEDTKYTSISRLSIEIANNITNIYEKVAVPLFIVSMISYIAITILQFRNIFVKDSEFFNRWLILTGILLSFILLIVAVTLFMQFIDNYLYDIVFYASGAIPLIQIFELVSIYTIICYIINLIKIKKGEKNENSSIDTML